MLEQRAAEPAIQIGADPLAAQALEHRSVEARGHFEAQGLVLLDNRIRGGRVGYEVVMPLRVAGSNVHVLVNRGWVSGTGDRRKLPPVPTPPGEVRVTGLAVIPGRKAYELSAQTIEGAVWQNITIERYRAQMRYHIHPIVIRQTNDLGDGLVRDWAVSAREINVHRSYAFQWFSLALLILLMYLFFSLRRVPKND